MEKNKTATPDNESIEIIHYQASQGHALKNMTFLRPVFCHVLRGTKIMQLTHNKCVSGAGNLIFVAPHESILMQHITEDGGFASEIVAFPAHLLREFNSRYADMLKTAQDITTTTQLPAGLDLHEAWQKTVRALTKREHPQMIKHHFEGFLLRLAIAGYRITVCQNEKTFSQRVIDRISRSPETEPMLADIAKALFVSESTLLRRLKSEGTHFRQLKDDVYLSLAMEHVQGNQMPIKQIACLAGYSSTSRFIARFKERFGLTPGALRKVMLPDNASE
ncbi:AraC-like DNA-binding protein [Ewingella americana]